MASPITLPAELLREIVLHAIDFPRDSRKPQKFPWQAVAALVNVSGIVREFALDAWFYTFLVHSTDNLRLDIVVSQWPSLNLSLRVREICLWSTRDHAGIPLDLSPFPRLSKLTCQTSGFPLTSNAPSSLHELDFSSDSCGPAECASAVQTLPQLRILRVHIDKLPCPMCGENLWPRYMSTPPAQLVYNGGLGLPRELSKCLSPLRHLHTVALTYSYAAPRPGWGAAINWSKIESLWHGECATCISKILADDNLRRSWVDAKHEYERPPALEKVVWSFSRLQIKY